MATALSWVEMAAVKQSGSSCFCAAVADTDHPREVADPWFTGDFEATWQDILEGCTALLEELR